MNKTAPVFFVHLRQKKSQFKWVLGEMQWFMWVCVCVCVSLTNWDRFLNSFQLSGTQTVLMLITHSPAHTTAPGGRNNILLSTENSLRCVFTLHVCCDSRLPPPTPLLSVCFHVRMLSLHVCREKLLFSSSSSYTFAYVTKDFTEVQFLLWCERRSPWIILETGWRITGRAWLHDITLQYKIADSTSSRRLDY